jgi:hypothetical protein
MLTAAPPYIIASSSSLIFTPFLSGYHVRLSHFSSAFSRLLHFDAATLDASRRAAAAIDILLPAATLSLSLMPWRRLYATPLTPARLSATH